MVKGKKKVLKIVSAPVVIKKKKKLKVVSAPVVKKKKKKLKLTDGVYDEFKNLVITNDNWEF